MWIYLKQKYLLLDKIVFVLHNKKSYLIHLLWLRWAFATEKLTTNTSNHLHRAIKRFTSWRVFPFSHAFILFIRFSHFFFFFSALLLLLFCFDNLSVNRQQRAATLYGIQMYSLDVTIKTHSLWLFFYFVKHLDLLLALFVSPRLCVMTYSCEQSTFLFWFSHTFLCIWFRVWMATYDDTKQFFRFHLPISSMLLSCIKRHASISCL